MGKTAPYNHLANNDNCLVTNANAGGAAGEKRRRGADQHSGAGMKVTPVRD